ncbi:MAG: glycosyltransferase [Maritimibacter sp.]
MTHRHVNILGTRGIPAAHGGFETFAAKLAPYLVAQGWTVNVYCQDDDGRHTDGQRDIWNGINRIFFHASRHGPVGTMEFDLKCARHVTGEPGIDLVNQYFVSIARIEPENSILELVQGASRIGGTIKTVVLGKLDEQNAYHNQVRAAASDAVIFPGAIYDQTIVKALRFHALAYLHGHQVGGTNPSLVEALGAGNAVLAHDNRFNRWTAGPEQFYFDSADAVADRMAEISTDPERRSRAKQAAIARHAESFRWDQILSAYEAVLARQAALA